MKPLRETYVVKLTHEECTKLIPQGSYCYTRGANGEFLLCPFWSRVESQSEQQNGFCHYLKVGDWQHPGIGLLWDQCKECGVNEYHSDYTDEF